MAERLSPERLAEVLWTARKKALGDADDGRTFADCSARIRKQYAREAAEVTALLDQDRADFTDWHDMYQQYTSATDGFLCELLDLLPGADQTGADAYDQIPRGIEKLKAERDHYRERLAETDQGAAILALEETVAAADADRATGTSCWRRSG